MVPRQQPSVIDRFEPLAASPLGRGERRWIRMYSRLLCTFEWFGGCFPLTTVRGIAFSHHERKKGGGGGFPSRCHGYAVCTSQALYTKVLRGRVLRPGLVI